MEIHYCLDTNPFTDLVFQTKEEAQAFVLSHWDEFEAPSPYILIIKKLKMRRRILSMKKWHIVDFYVFWRPRK